MDFGPLGDRSIFIWGSLKDDILAWIETWNWFYNCNILKDLSPKRRGHTYNQHHQTPEYSTLTRFWSKMLHTHRQTPQDLFDPQDLRSTHYALWTHSHLQTFESPDPCRPLLTHAHTSQKNNFIQHSQSIYTREHKLSVHFNPRNFSGFDQIPHCLSLLNIICSNESARITKHSGKREASSLIRWTTCISSTQSSSKFLLSLLLLQGKTLSLASQNQRKRSAPLTT
jgi:hypothetical protein